MIKVVYKKPSEKPYAVEIENTLEKLQEMIGGYIEVVPANENGDILMLVDEDGRLKELEHNVYIGNTSIVGNVIFLLKGNNEDFDSLTNDMIQALIKLLN